VTNTWKQGKGESSPMKTAEDKVVYRIEINRSIRQESFYPLCLKGKSLVVRDTCDRGRNWGERKARKHSRGGEGCRGQRPVHRVENRRNKIITRNRLNVKRKIGYGAL